MFDVNFLAVALGAATFLMGGLWYGPFAFGPRWSKEAGPCNTGEPGAKPAHGGKHPGPVFLFAYLFSFVSAWALAFCLGPDPTLMSGAKLGALVGATFAAASFGVNYQFAGRSWTMWAIDGGYHTLQLTLAGVVIALVG